MGERVKLSESAVAHVEARLAARGRDLTKPHDVWDDLLRGLVLRREPSGRKTWQFQFHVNGRRSRVKLGEWPALCVADARAAAKVAAGRVAQGQDLVAEKRAQREAERARRSRAKREQAAVLGAFVDGPYREWAEQHLRSHRETVQALRTDFAAWWTRPMDGLTVLDIERWRRDELKRGIRKSTVNRGWQRLRAVLGKAVDWRVIPGPAVTVKRYRLDERGRVRYLSAEERSRLTKALDDREQRRRDERERMNAWLRARSRPELPAHGTYTDHLKPLVLLLLNSGLRRGEALRLSWGALDFGRGMICVHAATSKSGQSRDVPMTAQARAALATWREQHAEQAAAHPQGYVFARPGGARLKSVSRAWSALTKAAGLLDFRLHDCRHDYASRLAMAGVDLLSIAKLLGHSDVKMSQRYAHLAPGHLRDAVRRLESAA